MCTHAFISIDAHTNMYVYTHTHIHGILRWTIRTQGSKPYSGDLIEKEVLVLLPYSISIQTIFPFGKHCHLLGQGLFLICSYGTFSPRDGV